MYYYQQIVQVNGEQGAREFQNQMGANSSALLLDNSQPLVWVCQTDGAGYKTVTPYQITPYVPPEEVKLDDLIKRLESIEEKINESNSTTVKRKTKSESESTESA